MDGVQQRVLLGGEALDDGNVLSERHDGRSVGGTHAADPSGDRLLQLGEAILSYGGGDIDEEDDKDSVVLRRKTAPAAHVEGASSYCGGELSGFPGDKRFSDVVKKVGVHG